jgi:hypothetical protein
MIGSSLLQTLARRNIRRMDQSMPFMNVDYLFAKFPGLAPDKVLYMTRLLQGSFIAGAAFVFLFINPPYSGADYENAYKSWYYNWTHNKLEKSGQLYENQRVKRDFFYSPGGAIDPMIKVAEKEEA